MVYIIKVVCNLQTVKEPEGNKNIYLRSGPEVIKLYKTAVIKLFSRSTQLSRKYFMLINLKLLKISC